MLKTTAVERSRQRPPTSHPYALATTPALSPVRGGDDVFARLVVVALRLAAVEFCQIVHQVALLVGHRRERVAALRLLRLRPNAVKMDILGAAGGRGGGRAGSLWGRRDAEVHGPRAGSSPTKFQNPDALYIAILIYLHPKTCLLMNEIRVQGGFQTPPFGASGGFQTPETPLDLLQTRA